MFFFVFFPEINKNDWLQFNWWFIHHSIKTDTALGAFSMHNFKIQNIILMQMLSFAETMTLFFTLNVSCRFAHSHLQQEALTLFDLHALHRLYTTGSIFYASVRLSAFIKNKKSFKAAQSDLSWKHQMRKLSVSSWQTG